MKKKPQTKDANPDPKISKDELSDSELNKATGGKVAMADFPFRKIVDKSSP